jgi:hypothetical protein
LLCALLAFVIVRQKPQEGLLLFGASVMHPMFIAQRRLAWPDRLETPGTFRRDGTREVIDHRPPRFRLDEQRQ